MRRTSRSSASAATPTARCARKRLGEPKRFSYGATPIESMEVWTTSRPNAPVMVFVHGGAWRVGLAKEHCYAAELYVNAGAHYAVLDFINVDQAGGDLMPMAEQIRRAIAWIGKNAASFGGDPDRIYVSGHSSGAHLAGATLVTDWAAFGAPAGIIKGAVLCSGIYDLKPARLSKRGAYVKFTDAMEDALSTQRHLARINCPVVLAYGTYETPEFQRQSRDFAAALQGRRQAGHAPGRRGLQPLRNAGDLCEPLRLAGARGAAADEACVMN